MEGAWVVEDEYDTWAHVVSESGDWDCSFSGVPNEHLAEINRDRPGFESTGCQFQGF